MRTRVTEMLGIEFPLLAFTHCRDVAAAVSAAGGLGVLGAVAHSPEQLAVDLKWIREHAGGKPFGVDLLIPRKYAGSNEGGLGVEDLRGMIPDEHRKWIDDLLERYGVPAMPADEGELTRSGRTMAVDPKSMAPLIDVAYEHGISLFASALGSPPEWLIERSRKEGVPVAALAGRLDHAIAHRDAGVDLIIAQGTEGGGHTGEIGSVVLWPQIIDAVAPLPVLAAGGIGNGRQVAAAMAMGAAGVWTGSLWLTVEEAEAEPAEKQEYLNATSEDTVRSRSFTGKPCRMLKNDWTEAWADPKNPQPLGMPLQGLVTADAIRRTNRYASVGQAQKVAFNAVGQVVGQMNKVEKTRDVIARLVSEYAEAVERLQNLLG